MSSISSSLLFKLEADIAEFKKSLDEAGGHLKGFGEGLDKLKELAIEFFAFESIKEGAEKLFEFSQEIGEVTNKVQSFSDLSGTALVDLTASIKSTSDTFGTDFNETLKATNTLSKQMGISWQDAADLIQKGTALNHVNATQFLQLVQQYSPTFKQMGVSAEGAIAILSQTLKSGIASEDGINAIAKAAKNLTDLKAPAIEALNAIGISGTQIQQQLKNGSITVFEAIQMISAKLKDFKGDSTEVAKVIDDVFGKTGRKAGLQFIESLSGVKTEMKDLIAETGEAEKANLRLVSANEELDKVWVQMFGSSATSWTSLKATLTEIGTKSLIFIRDTSIQIGNFFIDWFNNSMLFRIEVQALVTSWKQVYTAFKDFGIMLFDTLGNAGTLLKDLFTGNFKKLPEDLKNVYKTIANDAIQFGKDTAENFKDAYENVVNNKPIKLISPNSAKTEGQEAGKEFADGFASTISGHEDIGSKGGKQPKAQKSNLGIIDLKQVTKGISELQKYQTVIAGATKQNYIFRSSFQQLGDSIAKNIQEKAYPAAQQLGQQLGQMAVDGKSSFADMANAAEDAAKNIVQTALVTALANTIAANSDIPFPADVIAIALGTAAIEAAFSAIPKFESGGSVGGGGMAIVGEKGAELVNLPAGSYVNNANDTKKILGGQGSNNLQIRIFGKQRGTDIFYSQKEVVRQRANTI